ncbi:MAG: GFA family protein [Hyphomonadaceae bacterium]
MRKALPPPPYVGGCLCGRVRYAYKAQPRALNACHCNDCKRLTGSDYVKMLLGERLHFAQTGETQVCRKRADSGREMDIRRCAACGTRLWHEPVQAPQFIFICAGALDDAGWVVPTSHIWVERADEAVQFAPDALLVQGQPKDRQVLFDHFDRLYPSRPPPT